MREQYEHIEASIHARLEALARQHRNRIMVELDFDTLLCVVGNLQLALRHPMNKGRNAQVARDFLEYIYGAVGKHDAELSRLFRLGDDPGYDRKLGGGEAGG